MTMHAIRNRLQRATALSPAMIALALLLTLGCKISNADERPTILLVVSKDNAPDLGCCGDSYAKTPNLDRFAARGIRLETANVTQAVCSPAREAQVVVAQSDDNGET